MKPRYRKLLRDVYRARGRFAVMVSAIAIGCSALVAILTTDAVIKREVARNFLQTIPASAELTFGGNPPKIPQANAVLASERSRTVYGRVLVGKEWLPLRLTAKEDFANQRMDKVTRDSGAWPPSPGSIAIERSALKLTGPVQSLNAIFNGKQQTIAISAVAHDPGSAPADQEHSVYAFTTPETLSKLTGASGLDTVHLLVAGDEDRTATANVLREIGTKLVSNGTPAKELKVLPKRHPHESQMNGLVMMLSIFGGLSVLLGSILVATLMSGLLTEQGKQIAVMKVVGARTRQVFGLYALLTGCLGLIGALLSIPIGVLVASLFSGQLASLLNFDIVSYAPPSSIVVLTLLLGTLLPIALTVFPLWLASRRTIREALADTSIDRRLGRLARFKGFSPTINLALRNSVRKRSRLIMSLTLLGVAGAFYLTTQNQRAAWGKIVSDSSNGRRFDAQFRFREKVPLDRVQKLLAGMPEIEGSEPWDGISATAVNVPTNGGPHSPSGKFPLVAIPSASKMEEFQLLSGRWVKSGERGAIVLNEACRRLYPSAKVGDSLPISVDHISGYTVVGICRDVLMPPIGYVDRSELDPKLPAGMTNGVRIALKNRSGADEMARKIESKLASAGIDTASIITHESLAAAQAGHFYLLVYLLLFVSVLLASVGGLGLGSSISAAVLERTREIGVMRAIGARRSTILGIVLSESLFIAVGSLALAIPLSVPLSSTVGDFIGTISFNMPLPLVISPFGLLSWLALVLFVAALAALVPALRAAALTIRETLAYS